MNNFLIVSASDLSIISWDDAKPTTINKINKSQNGQLAIVSWTGSALPLPNTVNSASYKDGPYIYPEILTILTGSLWKINLDT